MIRVMWAHSQEPSVWHFYTEEDGAIFDTKDAAKAFIAAEKRNPDNKRRLYRVVVIMVMFA